MNIINSLKTRMAARLLALTFVVAIASAANAFDFVAPATAAAPKAFACQTYCPACTIGSHALLEGGTNYINFPHDCLVGDCGVHTKCSGDETEFSSAADFDAAAAMIERASSEELRELLRSKKQLSLNATRGSVQLADCAGSITGNVPLSKAQLAGLDAVRSN